jgi:hypothetical protein
MRKLSLACGLMVGAICAAGDALAQPDTPSVMPVSGDPVGTLEPEVTIIQTDKGTLREYSVAGKVYMVKVVPNEGPEYYLLDLDGDGELDVRKNDVTDISIPQWVLYSW